MTETELVAKGGSRTGPLGSGAKEQNMPLVLLTQMKLEFKLNYTTNWRLLRYSEVLLLAAEAYNKATQI
jgi:hypothetical protein